MSDWNPVVYRLGNISSIEGSDFLELTTIMNTYPCVLRKGEFKEGQLVSWIPYDSIVPNDPKFSFLAPKEKIDANGNIPIKYRTIKAKRIRGTFSEGLILEAPPNLNEGDSIIDFYKLEKRVYEEELPDTNNGENESNPKSFSLFKYDLEGMAKYGYAFNDSEEILVTEKLEGENCAFIFHDNNLMVRSRTLFKIESQFSHWWEFPNRINLREKLNAFPDLAVWGELYGNVSGWKYDCQTIDKKIQRNFRIFDIWDIKQNKFLEWNQVEDMASKLNIDTVPVLYKGKYNDQYLRTLAEGKSTIGSCVREGIVIRSVPEACHSKLGRKIIKLKGKDYKLAKG